MSIVSPRSALALPLLLLSALPALSCRRFNSRFCEAHPQDVDCGGPAGGQIDAGTCTNNAHCSHPTPVCDIASSMCVQCIAADASACSGTTPVCGLDETCRGCTVDSECASLTCLPDGSCAPVMGVLYASPDGADPAACLPNDRCSLARALDLIDGERSTIRLDPGIYGLPATLVAFGEVHLVGRRAVLDRNAVGSGPTLAVESGTTLSLDYVTVQGGDGDTGDGIDCNGATLTLREVTVQDNDGVGVSSAGCTLAIAHSQILGNRGIGIVQAGGALALTRSLVLGNQGGGLALDRAAYDVENDVIAKNGGPSSGLGGVSISSVTTPVGHVFAFNTVAQNQATLGTTAGVVCKSFANPVPMTGGIVFDNAGFQVEGGNCVWTYSDIGPVPVTGASILSSDPLFVDPVHNNFHLQVSSPARDAADPAAALAVDVDGDVRPQGAGRDMGADEIK